jgi:hypothetical protein
MMGTADADAADGIGSAHGPDRHRGWLVPAARLQHSKTGRDRRYLSWADFNTTNMPFEVAVFRSKTR